MPWWSRWGSRCCRCCSGSRWCLQDASGNRLPAAAGHRLLLLLLIAPVAVVPLMPRQLGHQGRAGGTPLHGPHRGRSIEDMGGDVLVLHVVLVPIENFFKKVFFKKKITIKNVLDVLEEVLLVGEGLVAERAERQSGRSLRNKPFVLLSLPPFLLFPPFLLLPCAPINGALWWGVRLLRGLEALHHDPHLLGPGLLLQPAQAVFLVLVLVQEREGADASLHKGEKT